MQQPKAELVDIKVTRVFENFVGSKRWPQVGVKKNQGLFSDIAYVFNNYFGNVVL